MIHMLSHLKNIKNFLTLLFVWGVIFITGTACGNEKIDAKEESEKILNKYFIYGDSDTAIIKMKELLEEIKKREGNNTKNIVITMYTLGAVNSSIGNYDEAEKYLQEAMDISESIKLNEWPIDDIFYLLAQVANSQGNCELGIDYSQKALIWKDKIYGEESWQVGLVNLQLGFFYKKMEKYKEAEIFTLKGLESTYEGIQEVSYVGGYFTLGEIKLKQEKYEEALEALEEARTNYLRIYSGKSTKELKLTVLLPIYSDKADAYIGLGKYEDAMNTILRGYGYIANLTDFTESETELKEEYIDKVFNIWKLFNNKENRSEFDSWLAKDAMY